MLSFVKSYWQKLLDVRLLVMAVAGGVLYSCASVGTLGGGDYDETPPSYLASNPAQGQLNASRKRITIEFDENITLDKPGEKIVVSPPQNQQPEIRSSGKRVVINLQDSLQPNTTYTFDFADAVRDNNEGNPLEQFSYSFSTGATLDTLEVAGTLLNAADLEPVKGMLVGLHADLADSAFVSKPFERVGRTDSRGRFRVRGLAPGSYRIFGLADANGDFFYSQGSEAVAFCDTVVVPSAKPDTRQDTVWSAPQVVDSLVQRAYTHYYPDNLLLYRFVNNVKDQRLARSERGSEHDFTLNFTAPADTLPVITGLNFDASSLVVERMTNRIDTLKYWITDSLVYKLDTLRLTVGYLYTDSLKQLVPRVDTLSLALKNRPQPADASSNNDKAKNRRSRRGEQEVEKQAIEYLLVELYAPNPFDVYDYLSLTFPEPLARFDSIAGLHLSQKIDSTWVDVPFELTADSLNMRTYNLFAEWKPGASYEFVLDSAAVYGVYGRFNDKQKREFKVKSLDSYGQVFFNITGLDVPAFVELLNGSDQVVRTVTVQNGRADFYYLDPGKYGARIILDVNNNGVWDTGDYRQLRQPERVYYYPQTIEFKANFDVLQDWDLLATPVELQKPEDLKKQKPEKRIERRRNDERNNNNRNGGFNSGRNSAQGGFR